MTEKKEKKIVNVKTKPKAKTKGKVSKEKIISKAKPEIKVEPKKKKEKVEQLIYIGPMLKSGVLFQNSIFMGIPKYVEEDIKKCPAIKKLFISTTKLAESKKNLKKRGTLENIFFKEIQKYNLSQQ